MIFVFKPNIMRMVKKLKNAKEENVEYEGHLHNSNGPEKAASWQFDLQWSTKPKV